MKMKLILLCAMGLALLLCVGCATQETMTKGDAYPKMYSEKPLVLLVLPAMNESTAVDAKEYYNVTIASPLAFNGYYVLPTEVVTPLLQAEGISDSELVFNKPLNKFKELLGADAVLFVKIKKWNTVYYVIGGYIVVSLDMTLKSTVTNQVLWENSGEYRLNTTQQGGGGLAGLAVQIVGTAIKTAASDYIVPAKMATNISLSPIPAGRYSPKFAIDRTEQIPKR
jgi:hypothetical protein